MKIKILQDVRLDLGKGLETYSPSPKIIEIEDEYAKKEKLLERYKKYPKHIKIIEEQKKKGK